MSKEIYNQIENLGVSDIVLIGHSMSGKISLYISMLDTKKLISKIILLAPSPPTIENLSDIDRYKMLKQHSLDRAIQNVKNGSFNDLKPIRKKHAIISQFEVDSNTWNWWIVDGMNHSILEKIKNIPHELHLIFAKDDNAISYKEMKSEVIDRLNFTTINEMNNVGHLIPLEKPFELALLVSRILFYDSKN